MKSVLSTPFLSLLGFLLLIAPFYDQCNGHGMRKIATAPAEEHMVDTTAIETPTVKKNNSIERNPIVKDSIVDLKTIETPFYLKAYEYIDVESNQNAFELAYMSSVHFEGSFAEFKEELSKDFKKHKYDGLSLFVRSFSFVFIVFFTFFILILSFSKKIKWVYKLSIANLSLILITLICTLVFDPFFETYKQFKWGYYAFTVVQLLIFYTSKFNLKSKN